MEAWKIKTIRLELSQSESPKSINTQQGYLDEIRVFELWRDGRPITGELITLYLKELTEAERKPYRKNFSLCALRWWVRRLAKSAQSQGLLTPEELEGIIRAQEEVKHIHALRLEPFSWKELVSKEEFSALISACEADVTAAGVRDRAMLSLAYYLGMMRDEITGLDLIDFESEEWGKSILKIHVYPDTCREIDLDEISQDALINWLAIRGKNPGALFCGISREWHLNFRHLSGSRLYVILANRCQQAGIRHINWVDLKSNTS